MFKDGEGEDYQKRTNKKELRAKLKLEAETREASIAGLQKKLKQATDEIKVTQR